VPVEYRVETRVLSGSSWFAEGDHTVFKSRAEAEKHLERRARWYGNPTRFEHRVTCRSVTEWSTDEPDS
jgi:hypothetical protein